MSLRVPTLSALFLALASSATAATEEAKSSSSSTYMPWSQPGSGRIEC